MIPKELQRFGVSNPRKPKARRLVACCTGETGTGKTDLALRTMPRPLLMINIDRNLEPLEERYFEQDDILIKDIRLPKRIDQKADEAVWTEYRELYETAVGKNLIRSVAIDTMDATYELVRRAKLGTLDFGEAPQSAYSSVNSSMKWLHSFAKDNSVNLLATHRPTNEFKEYVNPNTGKKGSKATGNRKRAGWKDAEFEAQICFEMSKDSESSGVDRYKLTITKCTANPELECEDNPCHVLIGSEITWANLGVLACPWTETSDWV